MRSSPMFVVSLAVAGLAAGCPPSSLIGQPCEVAGDSPCEGLKQLRCDGNFYVLLAECSATCVESSGAELVPHDGAISADETWACEDGIHAVSGVLDIAADVTLSIKAGALVRLDPASRINADVAGRVEALGTAEAPILLTSSNGQSAGFGAGAEGGINVFAVETGDPSRIEHTIIERGIHGLGVFGLSSDAVPPVVVGSTFRDNENFGIFITCNQTDAPIPDFAADNEFFNNGAGEVSTCGP